MSALPWYASEQNATNVNGLGTAQIIPAVAAMVKVIGQIDDLISAAGFGMRTIASKSSCDSTVLAKWGYYDYLSVGSPSKGGHAFQTLCKLDNSGNRTLEEFHYAYDQQGRLCEASFAQTPSNMAPDSSGYYDGYEAETRARAHYEYDGGGRLTWLGHYWDSLASGNIYTTQAILGQVCNYEYSGLNRGLKTDSEYKVPAVVGPANWATSQTDTYGYDTALDYLTASAYGDGLAYSNPTWSYDAAGNRSDAVVDNLNRAVSTGGIAATTDILGNRLTMGSNSYGWDAKSRMTSFTSGQGTTYYVYRADGMRISKSNASGSTSYRYDGQMGMEDVDFTSTGGISRVTDYGLGGRGLDAIFVTQGGITSTSYPIFDTHGNQISTLSKQNGGGFTYAPVRTYDAWGNVRRGAQSGDPSGRYCASLGHKQDDESNLIYMRARYYDAGCGRFLSEDPDGQGGNLYSYCGNDPIGRADSSGRFWWALFVGLLGGVIAATQTMFIEAGTNDPADLVAKKVLIAFVTGFVAGLAACFGPWAGAAAAAGAIAAFMNSAMSDFVSGGWGAVNWKKAFAALGIGGVAGALFGALGAAEGNQLACASELADMDNGQMSAVIGGGAGSVAGNAIGTAVSNAYY